MVHVKTQMDSEQMRILLKKTTPTLQSKGTKKRKNTLWMGEFDHNIRNRQFPQNLANSSKSK